MPKPKVEIFGRKSEIIYCMPFNRGGKILNFGEIFQKEDEPPMVRNL